MRYLTPILSLLLCGQSALATDGNLPSATVRQGLMVAFKMPRGVPAETGAAWVVLESDGKCLARKGTRFEKPVFFEEVALGKKVIVRVVPFFVNLGWGMAGQAETRIPQKGGSELTIALKVLEATPVEVTIVGWNGKPFVEGRVAVRDAALGDGDAPYSLTTNEKGQVAFLAFPGRRYELEKRFGIPPTPIRFFFDVERAGKNEFIWRMDPGAIVRVRFFEQRGDQPQPFTAAERVSVFTETRGWSAMVENGELTLYRDLGRLKSAKQLRLVLQPDQADYDIIENGTFALTDEKEQVVDVVLRKRLWATFQVEGLDTKTNTPVGLKTYILDAETGKRLSGAGPGREFRLGLGRYLLAFWQSGYRLAQQPAVVTKEETVNLSIPLQEAPELQGVLLDTAGEPIHERAVLRLRYGDAPYLARMWARPDEKGAFRMPVDDRLAPVLWIQTQNAGSRLIKVTPETLGEGLTIRLQACRVTGQATVDEQVAGEKRLGLVWTPEAFPRLPVAACPIDGGRYEVQLEPGRYACYLARGGGEVIRLDDVVIADEPEKQLPPITLTQERWDADKRPMADHLDRF